MGELHDILRSYGEICEDSDVRLREADPEKDVAEYDWLQKNTKYECIIISSTSACKKWIRKEKILRAVLDDMAIIVGPYVGVIHYNEKKMQKLYKKAFKHSKACFVAVLDKQGNVKDGYTVTVGKTKQEAIYVLYIVEKTAQIAVKAESLGNLYPIFDLEAKLAQRTYEKSRKNLIAGSKNIEYQQFKTTDYDKNEATLRIKLFEYVKKIKEEGVLYNGTGDFSVRLNEENILITPLLGKFDLLSPADIVKINIDTNSEEQEKISPYYSIIHKEIYYLRQDVNVVIRLRSNNCSIFAAASQKIMILEKGAQRILGYEIPVLPYSVPGSRKFHVCMRQVLDTDNACILGNHGVVIFGNNLFDTFDYSVKLEKYAGKAYKKEENRQYKKL